MIDKIVDWAWPNYELIEPVASMQKQTSIKPNAGRGKWSLDFVLKTVFFIWAGWLIWWLVASGIDFLAGLTEIVLSALVGSLFFSVPVFAFLESFDFVIFFSFFPLIGA